MADKQHPLTPRRGDHRVLKGGLAEGTEVASGDTVREIIALLGLFRVRVRIELTLGDGSLAWKYVRPTAAGIFDEDGGAVHTTGNPSNVAVAAPDIEYLLEVDDVYGEAFAVIEYTDTAGGSTIKRVVVSAL